jgi:TPR repeat protein
MDWEYVRIWVGILLLVALGVALLWGLGHAVYLNRIGSRGWASTHRLLKSTLIVFAVALPTAILVKEWPTLWPLLTGRLGSAEGQFQTGVLLQGGDPTFLRPNQPKAVAAFRRAARQGHTQAQLGLARACYYGRGTARDDGEALRWARKAADAGQPLALVLAGMIQQESAPAEAAACFTRAAPLLRSRGEEGDAEACYSLGFLLREGLGVAPDPVEALAWMLRAQRLGISPMQGWALQAFEKTLTPDQRAQARTRAAARP